MTGVKEIGLDPEGVEGWRSLERLGRAMLSDVLGHLASLRTQPAWRPMPSEVKRRIAEQPLPQKPESLARVYEDFKNDVLPYGGGNLHPRFWGWVMGNGTPAGVLAEMLAAALNANLWGGSHGAVEIESLVLSWCKRIMGFPEAASGLLTSGCSLANLIGLSAARGRLEQGRTGARGLRGLSRTPLVYVSTEAHNSIEKAVDLLGLGREQLRRIPVNEDFTMNVNALAKQLDADLDRGFAPMAVVATAGTVGTGAIDALDRVAKVCRDRGVWMHVDGAFGALAKLDRETAELLHGIELADSLSFDFHKWMSVPYEAACVLIKNPSDHGRTFESKTAYLASLGGGPGAGSTYFCDLGPELSRGFRGLKVWMTLREHGIEKFARLIRQNIEQARTLSERVIAHPNLELLAPVQLNVVCFRYRGSVDWTEAERDRVNQRALVRLQESGIAVPSHTRIRGKFAIRTAFVNHRTRRHDLHVFLSAFVACCEGAANTPLAETA